MEFLKAFSPNLQVASPGRINLIGAHTDYNGGYVLPTAIDKKTTLFFQKNSSNTQCNVYSHTLRKGFTADLQQLKKSNVAWENYILGVLYEIRKRTTALAGFDCTIDSTIPIGAGISASAALSCGLATGLNELFKLQLSKEEIILLCRDAEHRYAGTQCGIMDQYASVMSKEGAVMLLDCETLAVTYIPIPVTPYRLLLLNSNITHHLASSAYNKRRASCEAGVQLLQKYYPAITSLGQVSEEMLAGVKDEIPELVYRRCSFVIAENRRVLAAVKALKNGNMQQLGLLLYQTHSGLRNDYEVSCPEIDYLVAFAKTYPQVLGARLMGGGFGGCTLNVVHEDVVDDFIKAVKMAYQNRFQKELDSLEAIPCGGTTITIL